VDISHEIISQENSICSSQKLHSYLVIYKVNDASSRGDVSYYVCGMQVFGYIPLKKLSPVRFLFHFQ
jgi:hypothetical protein